MKSFSNLLVLLCLPTFAQCTDDDSIIHRFVFDSDDIELPCSIHWSPTANNSREIFSWQKVVPVPGYRDRYVPIHKVKGIHLPGCYSSMGMQTRFEGRYSRTHHSGYKYMLLLPSTMEERAGKYACKYYSDGVNSWNGTVKIYDVHVVQKDAVLIDLPIGNVTSFTCFDACSEEMQKFMLADWNVFRSHEDMRIPRLASKHTGDHLEVRAEYKGEVSLYYCSMRGFAYTRTFLVNSVFKPVVYMKPTEEEILKREYEWLNLTCFVEANPEASIQWFLNSDEIVESPIQKVYIKTEEGNLNEGIFALPRHLFKKSHLSIRHVGDIGFGNYGCSACNDFGCTSGRVLITRLYSIHGIDGGFT